VVVNCTTNLEEPGHIVSPPPGQVEVFEREEAKRVGVVVGEAERMIAAVVAVEKWESPGLSGISKRSGKLFPGRLIREFEMPLSHGALERIWQEHGLIRKRCRKYQRKQDLAHIKARWALFQQISADTKDLDDIPRHWAQAQRLKLPVIQYTAREVCSGLLFWAIAEGRSASLSAVFASRIQQHLGLLPR
jgi:hypothetical protein